MLLPRARHTHGRRVGSSQPKGGSSHCCFVQLLPQTNEGTAPIQRRYKSQHAGPQHILHVTVSARCTAGARAALKVRSLATLPVVVTKQSSATWYPSLIRLVKVYGLMPCGRSHACREWNEEEGLGGGEAGRRLLRWCHAGRPHTPAVQKK